MLRSIDLSRFKVVYRDMVVMAIALIKVELQDLVSNDANRIETKFIEVLVINSNGNLEVLRDEAWMFQFIPNLNA